MDKFYSDKFNANNKYNKRDRSLKPKRKEVNSAKYKPDQLNRSIELDLSKTKGSFDGSFCPDEPFGENEDKNCTIMAQNDLMDQLKKTGSKIQKSVLKIKDQREKFERRAKIVANVSGEQTREELENLRVNLLNLDYCH